MSELEQLDKVIDQADNELAEINDLNELQQRKANYLGKGYYCASNG